MPTSARRIAKAETPRTVYSLPTLSEAKQSFGRTGIRRQGSVVFEEFLRDLQGTKGRAVYKELAGQVLGGAPRAAGSQARSALSHLTARGRR